MKTIITDRWKFIASMIVLLSGITLIFTGIWLPPIGVIDTSVEIVLGELLAFVGSVWGISNSYSVKQKELELRYRKYFGENEPDKESQDA